MNQEEYLKLYEKSLAGTLSAEEKSRFDSYSDDFDLNIHQWDEKLMGNEQRLKQVILEDIHASPEFKTRRLSPWRVWLAVASIVIVLMTSGIYFYTQNQNASSTISNSNIANVVLPGRSQATLTLSDGSKITLDDTKDGFIKKDKGSEITKLNTSLIYRSVGNSESAKKYNTVSTPNGGQYQIQLEDGTQVWLNATSSIHFPLAFTGKDRIVELEGEAYFEVAKDTARPFKINLGNDEKGDMMHVEVLGTHFNVSAYSDEDFKTTLAEGSVKVSNGTQKGLVLKPGQQSVLNQSSGAIVVKTANLKEALAWKNGLFIFDHENIMSIMRKLSRWYNIEVSYEGKLTNKDFVGTISRNESLAEVLKMLELTGTVGFDIKGKKVIVR